MATGGVGERSSFAYTSGCGADTRAGIVVPIADSDVQPAPAALASA